MFVLRLGVSERWLIEPIPTWVLELIRSWLGLADFEGDDIASFDVSEDY